MGVTTGPFKEGLDMLFSKIVEKVEQVEKNVTNEIVDALLEEKAVGGTPRLTGHLRSNYIITTDSPYDGVVGSPEAVDKSARDASRDDFNAHQNLIKVKDIHINNNVSYGPEVNSRQRFRESSIKRGLVRLKEEGDI